MSRNNRNIKRNSTLTSRQRLAGQAGQHFGGERDLYEVMGYPRHLDPEQYVQAYLRQDIAGRILDAFPDATWREPPAMLGGETFTADWKALEKRFNIWRAFHRLDRLMGMGHYGVLLLGLDGGEPTYKPAQGSDYNLIYLQPHSERTAQITQWEDNPTSARFGLPKMYRITTGVNWTGSGAGQKSINVHHSRVIHVAERALEDISIGTPRLERVFNRLMDLDKLLGGSAEMYWQNVAMMMALISNGETPLEPEDAADMKDQLEEMQNQLRRFLTLQNVDAKNLAPGLQGASPGEHIEWQLKIVAGAVGIPQRLLIGNEAGELASSQDETSWESRVAERREQLAGPSIVEEFVKRGERLGFLPNGFTEVEWPESDSLGEAGRAEIALKKSQALQAYMGTPGADLVAPAPMFLKWLGEDPADAEVPDDEDDLDESDPNIIGMTSWRANR